MLFFRNESYRNSASGEHVVVDLGNKISSGTGSDSETSQQPPAVESFVLSDNLVRISLPNGTVASTYVILLNLP